MFEKLTSLERHIASQNLYKPQRTRANQWILNFGLYDALEVEIRHSRSFGGYRCVQQVKLPHTYQIMRMLNNLLVIVIG